MSTDPLTPEAPASVVLQTSSLINVKLDITNNWTGVEELPFELVAERMLEMEAEGELGQLTVSFGRPVYLEGKGWACVFRMTAMGRTHVSPVRGVDAVDALQEAFAMVQKQLAGMARRHIITFNGSPDLGFAPAGEAAPKVQGCPVMGGGI